MEELTVGLKSNREWDLPVALSFSLEGIGAALFLWGVLLDVWGAALLGLGLVCAGGAALLAHLGNPRRFWRVIRNPSRAWMSRGALLVAGLVLVGGATILVSETEVSDAARLVMLVAALALAVLVMLYAGLLASSFPSIPFWNTPLLPALFLLHSLTSGAAIVVSVDQLRDTNGVGGSSPGVLAIILIGASLILTVLYIGLAPRTASAQESVWQLVHGPLKRAFVLSGLLGGLLMPFVLLGLYEVAASGVVGVAGALVGAATAFRLGGDVSFRYAILSAGFYDPVL